MQSTSQLVADAAEQSSRLVRDEIRLALAEMREKPKSVGIGLGLFGTAGLFALYGVGVLIAAGILALALVLPAWAAALIVAVVLFVAAGIAGLVGRRAAQRARPVPEQAVENVQRDIEELRERGTR
nr:phage holin family protein [Phytoactinopolyspora limicola]